MEWHEELALIEGADYEEARRPYVKRRCNKVCRRCGKPDLQWGRHEGRWRLFNSNNNLHECKRSKKKMNVNFKFAVNDRVSYGHDIVIVKQLVVNLIGGPAYVVQHKGRELPVGEAQLKALPCNTPIQCHNCGVVIDHNDKSLWWKGNDGYVLIAEMPTGHLFNAMKIIEKTKWNSTGGNYNTANDKAAMRQLTKEACLEDTSFCALLSEFQSRLRKGKVNLQDLLFGGQSMVLRCK